MNISDHERQSMLEILISNRKMVEKIANDTEEIREIWSEARSAFRLFTRIVSFTRAFFKFVVLPVALLLAAVYAWVHDGKAPTWLKSIADIIE